MTDPLFCSVACGQSLGRERDLGQCGGSRRPSGTTEPIEKYTNDVSQLTNQPTFSDDKG